MENREEEIKEEFIARAEEQREEILNYIDVLTSRILPDSIVDIEIVSKTYTDLAKQMNINFVADEQMKDIINLYMNNLNDLKSELENLKITEEKLLGESVLDKAQQIIPLIRPSLMKIKSNLNKANSNNLINGYKQMLDVKSQIAELKEQKMYLQGKLDTTKRKKTKLEIKLNIEEIDNKIQLLDNKLSELEFKENTTNKKDDEEMTIVPQETENSDNLEQQAEELHDDGNR